jgi:hypothetical protein
MKGVIPDLMVTHTRAHKETAIRGIESKGVALTEDWFF